MTKGYKVQKNEGIEVGIDYYLNGVRTNPFHYPCIYNLGCVYYQLEKYLNAVKWFSLAIKVQPSTSDAYYGCALSNFKLKRFEEALDALKSIP